MEKNEVLHILTSRKYSAGCGTNCALYGKYNPFGTFDVEHYIAAVNIYIIILLSVCQTYIQQRHRKLDFDVRALVFVALRRNYEKR